MSENEIKFARPEDIPQIVALGYQELKENGIENIGLQLDFDKILFKVTDLVLNHVVLVKRNDENDKIIDGAVAFLITPDWYSSTPMMVGMGIFVKPEKRSFKVIKSIVSSAKEYAIINKLPIVFGVTSQKDADRKRKLFTYLGFEDWGSTLVWMNREK